jgi:hypothetical protein
MAALNSRAAILEVVRNSERQVLAEVAGCDLPADQMEFAKMKCLSGCHDKEYDVATAACTLLLSPAHGGPPIPEALTVFCQMIIARDDLNWGYICEGWNFESMEVELMTPAVLALLERYSKSKKRNLACLHLASRMVLSCWPSLPQEQVDLFRDTFSAATLSSEQARRLVLYMFGSPKRATCSITDMFKYFEEHPTHQGIEWIELIFCVLSMDQSEPSDYELAVQFAKSMALQSDKAGMGGFLEPAFLIVGQYLDKLMWISKRGDDNDRWKEILRKGPYNRRDVTFWGRAVLAHAEQFRWSDRWQKPILASAFVMNRASGDILDIVMSELMHIRAVPTRCRGFFELVTHTEADIERMDLALTQRWLTQTPCPVEALEVALANASNLKLLPPALASVPAKHWKLVSGIVCAARHLELPDPVLTRAKNAWRDRASWPILGRAWGAANANLWLRMQIHRERQRAFHASLRRPPAVPLADETLANPWDASE